MYKIFLYYSLLCSWLIICSCEKESIRLQSINVSKLASLLNQGPYYKNACRIDNSIGRYHLLPNGRLIRCLNSDALAEVIVIQERITEMKIKAFFESIAFSNCSKK